MAIKGLEQAVENLSRISRTAVPGAAAMAISGPSLILVVRETLLAGRK
ncbi:phage tail protein, partial [Escherichia coli]